MHANDFAIASRDERRAQGTAAHHVGCVRNEIMLRGGNRINWVGGIREIDADLVDSRGVFGLVRAVRVRGHHQFSLSARLLHHRKWFTHCGRAITGLQVPDTGCFTRSLSVICKEVWVEYATVQFTASHVLASPPKANVALSTFSWPPMHASLVTMWPELPQSHPVHVMKSPLNDCAV